jgi:hypothetical protein
MRLGRKSSAGWRFRFHTRLSHIALTASSEAVSTPANNRAEVSLGDSTLVLPVGPSSDAAAAWDRPRGPSRREPLCKRPPPRGSRLTVAMASSWRPAHLNAHPGARPRPSRGRPVDDAQPRPDGQAHLMVKPGAQALPAPVVQADLAPLAALAVADQQGTAPGLEVRLGEHQGFADPQARAPEHRYQAARAQAVRLLPRRRASRRRSPRPGAGSAGSADPCSAACVRCENRAASLVSV